MIANATHGDILGTTPSQPSAGNSERDNSRASVPHAAPPAGGKTVIHHPRING